MITVRFLKLRFLLTGIIGFIPHLYAHDNHTVHPMLAAKSYEAWSEQTGQDLFSALGIDPSKTHDYEGLPSSSDSVTKIINPAVFQWTARPWTLKQWLMAGAIDEDTQLGRCMAHFYDPVRVSHSLTDPTDTGASDSFVWGTTGSSFPGSSGANQESWKKARAYYLSALTSETAREREENLAHTFYALGKVSHLLQDLSQPEHVRNDAHPIPPYRWIETHGRDNVLPLSFCDQLQNLSPLDWDAANFTKLEDFWNRGIYQENPATLDADASGSNLVGLSEFTNGNFIGPEASYAELTTLDQMHHAAYPRLDDTNVASTGASGIKLANTCVTGSTVNPVTGRSRKCFFLKKEHSGVVVEKHSVLSYSWVYSTRMGHAGLESSSRQSWLVSINAPDVLDQYHKILLPKAVQYTAGLLDYFFRGKLEVRITWDKDSDDYKLAITNKSGKALKGGSFTLYQDSDDASETRSVVDSLEVDEGLWDESSILENDETINATFQPSSGEAKGFMLVYQGIIGLDESNDEADPVEDGQAIAAYHFQLLRFNITWDIASDIDLYLTDPNGDVIWYYEPESSLGELDNDDIGGTGPENITLKQLVPGEYKVWVNFYRDWYPSDDPDGDPPVITPVNVELNTYYNSSTPLDNVGFELSEPNEGVDWPSNTIGPATHSSWYVRKLITVDNGGVVTQH